MTAFSGRIAIHACSRNNQLVVRIAAVLLAATLIAGCAQSPTIWHASGVASMNQPNVRLLKDGQQLGIVERQTIIKLLDIKNRIGQEASVGSVDLLIATGDQPNAFSTVHPKMGPVIAFNLPMINLFRHDWDAFAAIMGHEFAHLALGHGSIRKSREEARQGISTVLGTVAGLIVPMGGTLVDVASQAVSTIYSRDEERDADRDGLQYARKAGYDPHGAVRAWEMMITATRGGIVIPFLSTHPGSDERLATMKQSIDGLDSPSRPSQDPQIAMGKDPSFARISATTEQRAIDLPAPGLQLAQTTTAAPVQTGKARIYITSEPLLGRSADVEINGIKVTSVNPDQPYKGEIPVGKTVISVKGGHVVIDAQPQYEYILEVSVQPASGGSVFMFGFIGAAVSSDFAITLKETRKPDIATAQEPPIATPTVKDTSATGTGTATQVQSSIASPDIQAAQRMVVEAPANAAAWRALGKQYQVVGEHDKAARAYEEAIRLEPRNIDALEALGHSYARSGQKEKLRQVWERLGQVDKARAERFFSTYMLP